MQQRTGRVLYEHSWGDVREWAAAVQDLADWSESEIDRAVGESRSTQPKSRSDCARPDRAKRRPKPFASRAR